MCDGSCGRGHQEAEGDYPLLSAVYPKYVALKKHAEAYEIELNYNRPANRVHIGVQAVFEKRINKHLKPVRM